MVIYKIKIEEPILNGKILSNRIQLNKKADTNDDGIVIFFIFKLGKSCLKVNNTRYQKEYIICVTIQHFFRKKYTEFCKTNNFGKLLYNILCVKSVIPCTAITFLLKYSLIS